MNVFKFLKHIKKRWRWKRKWLAFGLLIVLIGWKSGYYSQLFGDLDGKSKPIESLSVFKPQDNAVEALKSLKGSVETYLQKEYVCGEETQKLGFLSSKQLLETHKKNPNWSMEIRKDKVVFVQKIDDLSLECKRQAYFGLDSEGNLTLFNGIPSNENIIRTFFQMNIQYLESSLPKETVKELHEGIRVTDIAEYNSVLSTFSDYAVNENVKSSKPE